MATPSTPPRVEYDPGADDDAETVVGDDDWDAGMRLGRTSSGALVWSSAYRPTLNSNGPAVRPSGFETSRNTNGSAVRPSGFETSHNTNGFGASHMGGSVAAPAGSLAAGNPAYNAFSGGAAGNGFHPNPLRFGFWHEPSGIQPNPLAAGRDMYPDMYPGLLTAQVTPVPGSLADMYPGAAFTPYSTGEHASQSSNNSGGTSRHWTTGGVVRLSSTPPSAGAGTGSVSVNTSYRPGLAPVATPRHNVSAAQLTANLAQLNINPGHNNANTDHNNANPGRQSGMQFSTGPTGPTDYGRLANVGPQAQAEIRVTPNTGGAAARGGAVGNCSDIGGSFRPPGNDCRYPDMYTTLFSDNVNVGPRGINSGAAHPAQQQQRGLQQQQGLQQQHRGLQQSRQQQQAGGNFVLPAPGPPGGPQFQPTYYNAMLGMNPAPINQGTAPQVSTLYRDVVRPQGHGYFDPTHRINQALRLMGRAAIACYVNGMIRLAVENRVSAAEETDLRVDPRLFTDTSRFEGQRTLDRLPLFLNEFAQARDMQTAAAASLVISPAGGPHTLIVCGTTVRAREVQRIVDVPRISRNSVYNRGQFGGRRIAAIGMIDPDRDRGVAGLVVGLAAVQLGQAEHSPLNLELLEHLIIDGSFIDRHGTGLLENRDAMLPLARLIRMIRARLVGSGMMGSANMVELMVF